MSGAALPPRLFGADDNVRRIAAGLVQCTLPRAQWTHEAHLAAVTVLLLEWPDLRCERDLPTIIARYNTRVGGVNDDTQGYHETITQYWIAAARRFHATSRGSIVERVNALLQSPEGHRDAPLRHYTPGLLFSVEARRGFVEPDRMRFETAHAAPAP
jgi:hypothetical protein